jgi:hypothetical protein
MSFNSQPEVRFTLLVVGSGKNPGTCVAGDKLLEYAGFDEILLKIP